jgi:hypothetical protein
VRVTIVGLFVDNDEEFLKDWYANTWTISCKEDGNIWIES